VIVWEASEALQIPTSSLFRVDGRWHVFAQRGQRARLTPVEIGQNNGRVAEVLDGIQAGTEVITHPSDAIEDGVLVAKR
jgi:HlyD family secretion protein